MFYFIKRLLELLALILHVLIQEQVVLRTYFAGTLYYVQMRVMGQPRILIAEKLVRMSGADGCGNQFGSNSKQDINCSNMVHRCLNVGGAGNNEQSINCANAPGDGVCVNIAFGSNHVQSMDCQSSTCVNEFQFGGNTQNTQCNSAGFTGCQNHGGHTTVLANGASCSSGADHSTTICQPGRTTVTTP